MSFRVHFSKFAAREMKKLDPAIAAMIMGWLRRHLEGCADPQADGKALGGNLHGAWRYRVGNYRILAAIQDREIVVLAVAAGHRREVYEGSNG